jgi:ABC-type phosphate transport system substrate-binding protein
MRSILRSLLVVAILSLTWIASPATELQAGAVTTQLNGAGSSYAAPAIEAWTKAVQSPPYSLSVNFTSTSSGDGRFEFANDTTNFAVTDIAYGIGSTDTTPPTFPFIYVPIVGAGIAFMYNIPGLTNTLQLSSYTACALLSGGITNWNDPALAADNPGVSLPNLMVRPVTESDSAGTNVAVEEWCIDEQPALWVAFANQQNHQSGGPGDGVVISATQPESNWPGLPGGLDQQSTSGVAGSVATNAGAIGAVQTKYATDLGFGATTPAKGVASVKNASGKYNEPTSVNVSSALAYATQNSDGTHQLNFNGTGPNVYNPSTYSYLLVKTTGSDPSLGAAMSGFVNYALTLGQQSAPSFGYATLGLSLEKYGVDEVKANVPGAVAPTASESNAYACGDLTPIDVQAGKTSPTCGVLNTAAQAGGAAATAGGVSLITNAPNGPFSSGQTLEVSFGANTTLTPNLGVYIEECSAPGGTVPTLPTQCDPKTHQHSPLFMNGDGSLDYKGYPIYALPDAPNLGETSSGGPQCDLANQCILYIGQNPNDFSQPHVWSSAFFIKPTAGDAGTNPGNGLPEVPFIIALPLLAGAVIGGVLILRRRRLLKAGP